MGRGCFDSSRDTKHKTPNIKTQNTRHRIARLEVRLSARFEILTEAVPVGPLRVQFTRVADPQKVLDDLCRKIDDYERSTGERVAGDQLGLPYWAELWDSAIGVGQWLVENSAQWGRSGQSAVAIGQKGVSSLPTAHRPLPTVLDLGCGMGLAGTVAAMLGARVTFGDIERESLLFAELNGLRYNPTARARRVDWQADDLGQTFDLILGSDVLYDRTQWTHLDRFFRRHADRRTRILLGEPGRQTGDTFIGWCQAQGWQFRQHAQRVPTRSVPIRLFELSLG